MRWKSIFLFGVFSLAAIALAAGSLLGINNSPSVSAHGEPIETPTPEPTATPTEEPSICPAHAGEPECPTATPTMPPAPTPTPVPTTPRPMISCEQLDPDTDGAGADTGEVECVISFGSMVILEIHIGFNDRNANGKLDFRDKITSIEIHLPTGA